MGRDDLKTLAAAILKKVAVTEMHKRLQKTLDSFGANRGYEQPVTLRDCNPDVSRIHEERGSVFLFLGDAKVAENETPDNRETVSRISRYVRTFAEMLEAGDIKGGCIAIATDDEGAADEWRSCLNFLTGAADIVSGDSKPADYIIEAAEVGFIIYW
jgi:hypothetical protein